MSITFIGNQTTKKDFQLISAGIQIIWNCPIANQSLISPSPAEGRPLLTVAVDLSRVKTSPVVDWFEVFWLDEATGEWKTYISTFLQNTLLTLEPGKQYYVVVSAPCQLIIPQEAIAPEEGVYTCAIYYCYLEGYEGSTVPSEWHSNWSEWCQWLAGYETKLIVDYIRSQGLGADMPILSIEKVEVPLSIGDAFNVIYNLPSFPKANVHICIGEENSGFTAIFMGNGTVMTRGWRLEQEVRGMEGDIRYDFIGTCTLAHELGHGFGLNHCGNPPCPMHGIQLTYDEWVNMGKRLWFCNTCRPKLLANWESRNLI